MKPNNRLPSTDWACLEILDAKLVELDGVARCEFCNAKLRWVHVLTHDNHNGTASAGCCCAAKLCFDYDAEAAEREVKNRYARLGRFVNLQQWQRSRTNPENTWRWVRTADGERHRVTVFLKWGTFGVGIFSRKKDGPKQFSPNRYATQEEAKQVAFEMVEAMNDTVGE